MLRTFAARGLAGLLLVFLPSFAAAQSQEVSFETVDKVQLKGTFYPTRAGNKSPCVLLLPKPGATRHQEGWDDLAKALSDAGYAVLHFDYRGHGDSTTVNPDVFWQLAVNQQTFKVGKDSKDRISSADFIKKKPFYLPMLVNDIEAAKNFLNLRNNDKQCNASNTIVIGAEDSAALGAYWVWYQFQKLRFAPDPNTGFPIPDPAGKTDGADIAACVWLSMPAVLNAGNKVQVRLWLAAPSPLMAAPPIPERVPMAFIYGDKDVNASKAADGIISALKAVHKLPDATKKRPVKTNKPAVGNELLKASSNTTKEIIDSLKSVIDKRANVAWEKRAQLQLQPVQLTPYFNIQY